jgi:3-carboxy-cis,cis-muconate cycloisomerase
MATVVDSILLGGAYSTPRMSHTFSDESLVRQLIAVEVALAEAEASLGLIPDEARADIIAAAATEYSPELLRQGIDETGHVLVPLIRELSSRCSGLGRGYVHWGATTQDVIDTAHALQLRRAIDYVSQSIYSLQRRTAELAQKEAGTPMVGRTHGQHALPTTFGAKVASWYWEFNRDRNRWNAARGRVLAASLAGAVGTFASFGPHGRRVQSLMCNRLGLAEPEGPWHAARDRPAEVGMLAGLSAGTCQRVANEIYLLQATEYRELEEPYPAGRIGSSTMPHKRNPVSCEEVITNSQCVRGEVMTLIAAMPQEHERQSSLWKTEWFALPNALLLLDSALTKLESVLNGLRIDRDRMAENLAQTRGAILSEQVMLTLGQKIGRERAHQMVYGASVRAFEAHTTLAEELRRTPEIDDMIPADRWELLFDPLNYIGDAVSLGLEPLTHLQAIGLAEDA